MGVPVEHLDYRPLCHGLLSMTDAVGAAGEAIGKIAASMRETCAT